MGKKESSIIKELKELKTLFVDGTLSREEFELAKGKLLNSSQKENKTLKEILSKKENNSTTGFPKKMLYNRNFKTLYIFIPLVIILFTLVFLLFGPFNIPVFSQFGDKLLGKNDNVGKEIDSKELEKNQIEAVIEEEKEVVEEEKIDEPVTNKITTTTKTPIVSCSQGNVDNYFNNFCYWYDIDGNKAAEWGEKLFVICKRTDYGPEKCPKKFLCTDEQISTFRNQIAGKVDGKARAEFLVNDKFFICFDELTSTVPGQTDTWYKQECSRIVCTELYADLCALPYDFQAEIDALQIELNRCLSDR